MSSTYLASRFRGFREISVLVAATFIVFVLLPTDITILLIVLLTATSGLAAYRLRNYFVTALSGAFLLRLGFIITDSVAGFLPTVPISTGHNQRAIELVAAWSSGQFLGVFDGVSPMRLLMAHILVPFYVAIGSSPVAGRVAIAFLSLLVGYLVFQIARHVTDRRTAVLASMLTLFWPTIVYRSVVIQREIIVTITLLAILWASIQWLDAITLPTSVLVLVATATMFILRKENLVLIAAVVGFVSLVRSRDKPYYLAGLGLLAVPFLAYFTLNFAQFTGHGTTLSPAAIDSFAYGRAHGDAVYLLGLHYETWFDVVLYAPIKVLYFLYTPFPWHIQSLTELFVGVSALGLFGATILARRGLATLREKPHYVGLLLSYLLTGVVAYAIIEMNYGAAVRRRIQFIPIVLLFAAVGLSKLKLHVNWRE